MARISSKQLWLGIDAVDALKAEILSVTSTVLGFLKFTDYAHLKGRVVEERSNRKLIHLICATGGDWLLIQLGTGRDSTLILHFVPAYDGMAASERVMYSSEKRTISPDDVSIVHAALDPFLTGMLEEFPELSPRLMPFIRAAEAEEAEEAKKG